MIRELSIKHGSDKHKHRYEGVYESLFAPLKNREIVFVEVGVGEGGSAKMWRDYFPHATIIMIDLFDKVAPSRVKFHKGDQRSQELWNSLYITHGKFDVVIDDGGHSAECQLKAFECGFPLVKDGGLYIIEDLHANNEMSRHLADIAIKLGEFKKNTDIKSIHFHRRMAVIEKCLNT